MGNGAAVQGSAALAAAGEQQSSRTGKLGNSWKAFSDSIKRSLKLKKDPPPRRDVICTVRGVFEDSEALDKVIAAVAKYPPGTANRWSQMLQLIEQSEEPTEEVPDPIRVKLEMHILVDFLFTRYNEMRSIANSDGLSLAREYIPRMYDKHSVDRGRKVSQREREERALADESFAYGEVNFDIFSTIFLRAASVYGSWPAGFFYDLGCGVGNLVYTAALIGNFKKVVGVEMINALLLRGEKRLERWERFSASFTTAMKETAVDFIEDDFSMASFWRDATFILLHWTALSLESRLATASLMAACREGTLVLSFTHALPGDDFLLLLRDKCKTSWGIAEFFLQEKITPPAQPRSVPDRVERQRIHQQQLEQLEQEQRQLEQEQQQQQQQLEDVTIRDIQELTRDDKEATNSAIARASPRV